MASFILKGDICFTPSPDKLLTYKDSYIVCRDGITKGVFGSIPSEYAHIPVRDYSGMLIIPGLVDLHIHAPQFQFRGTGMDFELTDWLNKRAFPCEEKYADIDFARKAYTIFAQQMKYSATTHAVIFSTVHLEAAELLMDMMEETGIVSYVGKVNMDRNAPDALLDKDIDETVKWLDNSVGRYERTFPIITPRFAPGCTPELMDKLAVLRRKYGLAVQSHLSENPSEVKWVGEICPEGDFYGDVYQKHGLFGIDSETGQRYKTVMAHCIYSTEAEAALMKQNGVFIAHCPASNANLRSGIAPMRKYLDMGIKAGLGSDVAGGHSESMLRAVCDTVQMSKLYNRLCDPTAASLTFTEAFYLASKGGGEFFADVNNGVPTGTFEEGGRFSAVVLDDMAVPSPEELSLTDRPERAAYLSADIRGVKAKYADGELIFDRILQ